VPLEACAVHPLGMLIELGTTPSNPKKTIAKTSSVDALLFEMP